MAYSKFEYEKEPVFYCNSCLSLNVKELHDVKLDICGECGNTDIEITDMDEWTKMFIGEYGKAFMTDEVDETD